MFRRLNKRPKRAAERHVPHSYVDVTRLIRVEPTVWDVDVMYVHGLSQWGETVRFSITEYDASTLTIVVTDNDFPGDRERRVTVPGSIDVEQFVRDFLIAGRW